MQKDKEFYGLVKIAEWVVCDSKILYLFSSLLRHPLKEAIPGSGFFPNFYMYHKDDENCRIFLLGAMNGVQHQACPDDISEVAMEWFYLADVIRNDATPIETVRAAEDEMAKIRKMAAYDDYFLSWSLSKKSSPGMGTSGLDGIARSIALIFPLHRIY